MALNISLTMKLLITGLLILFAGLQYELWFSTHGIREYFALKHAIAIQQQANQELESRNKNLTLDINNLKQGQEAIEEHARNDLGMVKKDETFYQVVYPITK